MTRWSTLRRPDRGAWSAAAASWRSIVAGARRPRRLGPEPRADRLPADRGPGLFPRRRAAARGRLARAHDARARRRHHARARRSPASTRWSPSPASPRSTTAPASSNAGVAYVILKDWEERGKGEDLLGLYTALSARVEDIPDGTALVIPPPAIQGIGNVAGATMKVEIRDGRFDYAKLQRLAQAIADRAARPVDDPGRRATCSSPTRRRSTSTIDRVKAETLGVPLGNALDALSLLCRLDLRRPVQQVRPRVPDLRAGRRRGAHQSRRACST